MATLFPKLSENHLPLSPVTHLLLETILYSFIPFVSSSLYILLSLSDFLISRSSLARSFHLVFSLARKHTSNFLPAARFTCVCNSKPGLSLACLAEHNLYRSGAHLTADGGISLGLQGLPRDGREVNVPGPRGNISASLHTST